MSKFDKASEAGRIVATVGAVEVIRCGCGNHTCAHCGKKHSPHGFTHCPHCGNPVRCALNATEE